MWLAFSEIRHMAVHTLQMLRTSPNCGIVKWTPISLATKRAVIGFYLALGLPLWRWAFIFGAGPSSLALGLPHWRFRTKPRCFFTSLFFVDIHATPESFMISCLLPKPRCEQQLTGNREMRGRKMRCHISCGITL